jgi:bacterioferritin
VKASKPLIAELNKVLGRELIAINQYFLHARMLKNWGLRSLGECEFKYSIHTMKEADKLIERILFLEGLPNLQDLGQLRIGQTAPETLKADLELETSLRASLADAILFCEQNSDFVSREMLSDIEKASESRIDHYETQQRLLAEMGVQNYLQMAAGEPESH